MKLYRRIPGKGADHPHAKALDHLKQAHRALLDMNEKGAMTHLGHALRITGLATKPAPIPAQPATVPDGDADDASY